VPGSTSPCVRSRRRCCRRGSRTRSAVGPFHGWWGDGLFLSRLRGLKAEPPGHADFILRQSAAARRFRPGLVYRRLAGHQLAREKSRRFKGHEQECGPQMSPAVAARRPPTALHTLEGKVLDDRFGLEQPRTHLLQEANADLRMFGLGGIFVEVLNDIALRVAPLTPLDAEEMPDEIRGRPLLDGARGAPPWIAWRLSACCVSWVSPCWRDYGSNQLTSTPF
jgi:ATP-grasp domain